MLVPVLVSSEFTLATLPLTEPWPVADTPNSMNGTYTWTPYLGTNAIGVVSQRLRLTDQGTGVAQGGRLEADLGVSDYRVTVEVPTFTHPGTGFLLAGVCARMQGDTSVTYYALNLMADAGTYTLALYRWLASTPTQLGSSVSLSAPGASTLSLDVRTIAGNAALTGYLNGVSRITATDTTPITSGRYIGLQAIANGTGNVVEFDNFSAVGGTTYQLAAERGVLQLTGRAGYRVMGKRLVAATGVLQQAGASAGLRREAVLRAASGPRFLTGRAATISKAGPAPSTTTNITGNPWVVGTTGILTTARTRIVAVRWVGATGVGHRVVITDGRGKRIWSSVSDTAHHTEADSLDGRLYTGVIVPQLDSGVLEIEVA